MRLDRFWIGEYKNLKDVTVDFDEDHWVTVVIGWNGTGKSNVLEALASLFRDLVMKEKAPSFPYKLRYRIHDSWVNIEADPVRKKDKYIIHVTDSSDSKKEAAKLNSDKVQEWPTEGKKISLPQFLKKQDAYLPRYIFGYYSGTSDRMQDVFKKYLARYDRELRAGKDPGLRRLFYALPIHSQFVLLAFILQKDKAVSELLNTHLGIEEERSIDSVLFVLKQPPWDRTKNKELYWGAKGVVRDFLDRLHAVSLAPIRITRQVEVSLWNKKRLGFRYLYVKDLEALRQLVGYETPREFFRDIESAFVSELIDEVRIRVKLRNNDGSVTFRELSEGEQQLLTVLGLLKFTSEEESLFLLDEPDTHLNPSWVVKYLNFLQQFVGNDRKERESSHVVLTTHNPLAIAELVKGQVQILQRNPEDLSISVEPPQGDPRGMGFAGILTSDMFGLESALDNHTINLIKERNALLYKELKSQITEKENARLKEIYQQLGEMRFNDVFDDPIFSEYAMLLEEEKKQRGTALLPQHEKANILGKVIERLEGSTV
ncbi:AAA family ATPase [Desulfovulcanus sp.]